MKGIALIIAFSFVSFLCAIMFDYCLLNVFGHNLHWALDVVFGVLLSEVLPIVTLVVFAIKLAGVNTPLIK